MGTHWKTFTNPDYLGSYEFQQGEEKVLQIVSVGTKEVIGDGGKKKQCIVAQLKDPMNRDAVIKPMILNATNCKTLTRRAGNNPEVESWAGLKITIYVDHKVKFGNDIVDGLRIKSEAPPLPILTKDGQWRAKWPGAVDALKTGQLTIEQLKKSFTITADVQQMLIDEATM